MNIKGAEAERFLADPPAKVAAALLYGPDAGLVEERGRALVRLIAGALDDPFRVATLSRRDVETDPARLADELAALALTGGRRVVRLRETADGAADGIAEALAAAGGGGFLVVEAGELPARSALRKLFESRDDLAAIGCYRDDEASLANVIRATLAESGLGIEDHALAFLTRNLGGDRQVTRRELEKLALYRGGAEAGGGAAITLDDAERCVGDSADITQEDLAFAVAGGDPAAAERAFGRALAEGVAAITLLRAVARHFQRLHQVAAAREAGRPLSEAVGRLRPPVFWKRRGAFEAQAGRWSTARLRDALADLTELEIDCKSSGAMPELLSGRALLRLAVNAPRRRG